MSEPWDALRDETVGVLRAGVADLASDVRPELEEFIWRKASEAARWKWASLNADTEERRLEAKANLRHLAAQVGGEAVRLELAASDRGKDILKKILGVAFGFLERIAPALLAKVSDRI